MIVSELDNRVRRTRMCPSNGLAMPPGRVLAQTRNMVERVAFRRFGDILLFGVTSTELAILVLLTPTFTIADWIYVLQHVIVLAIALMRSAPKALDRSAPASAAVIVAYTYAYAQVIYLGWIPGEPAWPSGGLVLVTVAAGLSLASLLALGRLFGVWPALRGLAMRGPYRFVHHPMYLAYMIGDVG